MGMSVLSLSGCYWSSAYEGDGRLQDAGPFAHQPRYVIRLAELNFGEEGERDFSFSGAPPESMTLMLRLTTAEKEVALSDAAWSELWQTLRQAGTLVRADLQRSDGSTACSAASPLAGGWVPAGTGAGEPGLMFRYFWHHGCYDIRLTPNEQYRLRLTVSSPARGRPLTMTPTLEGGGWESL